ncbi:MAG TPA: NAD-glutamate dehydrogenase [Solirubrobacteraceae bacterium]|jgi:glutamate dehydrogenase|nr:NAD-glutamate dehydrogenase [Solirubrobacteraceae bacterium]
MAVSTRQVATELVDSLCERVRERVEPQHAQQAEEFVRQYYRWVPAEDLARRGALDLYGAALAHWNLARVRSPGEAVVRVYNPTFEQHGWQSTHTAVEVVTDDMPFLVDSLGMALNRRDYGIHLFVHPVVRVERAGDGQLEQVLPAEAGSGSPESVIHIEIDRQTERAQLAALREELLRVLGDVRVAVEDWPRMAERSRTLAAELDDPPPPVDDAERREANALLEWLADDHFVFLGYREYGLVEDGGEERLRALPGTGLGILRDEHSPPKARPMSTLPANAQALARGRTLLTLTKANARSTVHRPAHLDYIGVKRFDAEGRVVGERRFLGLYTSGAYKARPHEIPLVRHKADAVVARAAFPRGSHDEKALQEILEALPRDELFQVGEEELYRLAMAILALGGRPRTRLFVRADPYGRFLSCLVFLPRERFNTQNRERIQEVLREAFAGDAVDFSLNLSESVLVRIHFVVRVGLAGVPDVDVDRLEARIVELTRSWTDALQDALFEEFGEEGGNRLFRRYGRAFPPGYQADSVARSAVADVQRIEQLAPDELAMTLYRPLEAPADALRCKLYRAGEPIALSDVLPMFEHAGLKVADERPYAIRPRDAAPVWLYDFGLVYDGDVDVEEVRGDFEDAFGRVWRGEVEDDGFNALVLRARLTWRQVVVLRAIARYLRQAGTTFSNRYMEQALTAHPDLARALVELFEARLDPRDQRLAAADALAERIEAAIERVESLDEDRIMRNFLAVIRAILRTNHFRPAAGGAPRPYLSFKLDPSKVPLLRAPRPRFEIFVYSPRVEGVHLRGGHVARGGLRWSDRREDFRTEVLGLMKAQTVKNALIVPVGAKGGFVVKRPPGGRDALLDEVVACYRTFVGGLLDLTDNIAGGEVVPPPDVVRFDGDDPYLVVAADKGTAALSDVANAVAAEYGFWLGDAFASGGSAGYDHKRMGITARGAWQSVKRHFRELGVDVQSEEFTVAGIGDMSGDVFGNGMLLSDRIRLVAAFDHRHVFIDPDPDPAASFAERRRLFELERSSWADYDRDLISEGGGVWPRTAKSIPLSPQARAALGVDAERVTPNEAIRAILRAPVDLLWNGGIGTYVRASTESDADVGDKAGDPVRVEAPELRCRVVGEGGNLGFTQRGRIEYARAGGRINTDAIDNAAGVNCSDREVNIKIVLDAAVAAGDMTRKQRNRLLAEMTDEVAALVLRDNDRQSEALTLAHAQGPSMLDVHERFIRHLEHAGRLDRALEVLPDADSVEERRTRGEGLTRPELAILLAYSKITLYEALLGSDLPEDPHLSRDLARYFPAPVAERFGPPMAAHRLRREIIATHVTNSLVDRAGTTFAFRVQEETGAEAHHIARAYAVAREVFAMTAFWDDVEALDNVLAAETQAEMLLDGRKLIERATRWLLRNRRRPLDIAATVAEFAEAERAVSGALPDLLVDADRDAWQARVAALEAVGVPAALAARVASFGALLATLDVVEVARSTGHSVLDVAALHFLVGARLRLHWLRDRIAALPRDDRWRAMARAALRDDAFAVHRDLTQDVLHESPPDGTVEQRLAAWTEANTTTVDRCLGVLDEIRSAGTYDLTTLPVGLREVRALIDGTGRVRGGG